MKNILLSCILTLATAASALVIFEHSPWRKSGDHQELEARLQRIEELLQERAQPDPVPGARNAKNPSVKALIGELEAQVWDSEKKIRNDLRNIFEKLLQRFDEAQTVGGPASNDTEDPAAKQAVLAKLAEMGIRLDEEKGMIVLDGKFGQPTRSLEFMAVAPGGKGHETMMIVDVVPSALKIALEALGLKEVPDPDPETGNYPENADGVYIYVSWDALKKPRRLEDMLRNTETREALSRCKWLFTASYTYTNTRTWERVFQADVARNLISLAWTYASACVLACPDRAAINENIWEPFDVACPEPGTPLKVLLCKEANPEWDKR